MSRISCSTGHAGVLCIVIVSYSSIIVSAYPTGADQKACPQQSPQVCHESSPQTSDPPYAVIVQATTYSAEERIPVSIVILNTTATYNGFLLGAHRLTGDTTDYIGSYDNDTSAQPVCSSTSGTGLTHTNNNPKRNLTFVWVAPDTDEGDIVFKAAIVGKQASVFWVNVTANGTLQASGNWSNTTSEPLTTSSSGPETSLSPPHKIPKDSECGHSLSCYGDCQDDGCTFLAAWHVSEAKWLVVSLKSTVSSSTDLWAAIGFGLRDSMNDASVTECVFRGTTLQAFMSYNKDHGNTKISPDPTVGLSQVSGSLQDGVLSCTFRRALAVPAQSDVFNLTAQNYHVLLARGTASGWDITEHAASDAFVTSGSYDLTLPVDIGAKPESYSLVKLHACLMTLAWLVAGSLGVLVARFFKEVWPSKTLCGVKVWFAVHRACMVTTFLCTALGITIIFIKVGGYSTIIGDEYQKAHPILGLIVTVLTVINPVMSIFRCTPNDERRPIFNWAHWAVGTSAYILGVVTLAIGTTLSQALTPLYVTYTVIGFGALHVLEHVILEVAKLTGKTAALPINGDLQRMISSESLQQPKQEYPQQGIQQVVLALHVLISPAVFILVIIKVID